MTMASATSRWVAASLGSPGGRYHSLALKSDGSLAAWGGNDYGQCDVPTGGCFLAIAAEYNHNLALQARSSYDDLLVTGSGLAALLQRDVDVAGDATIESMMDFDQQRHHDRRRAHADRLRRWPQRRWNG